VLGANHCTSVPDDSSWPWVTTATEMTKTSTGAPSTVAWRVPSTLPLTSVVKSPQLAFPAKVAPTVGGHGGAGTGGLNVQVNDTLWNPEPECVEVAFRKMPSGLNRNVVSVDEPLGSTTRWKTCEPSGFAGSTPSVPSDGTFDEPLPIVALPVCL
jgi:hypothetical protein